MKPGEDLKILFLFVLATVLYQIGITGVNADGDRTVTKCGCQCPSQAITDQHCYYNCSMYQCEQGPANCSQCVNSSFASLQDCQHNCRSNIMVGGCLGTRLGCCPDNQTPKSEEGKCPGDEASNHPDPIRWDLIAAGICGMVLLLAVVTLVGMATYAYRQKHKQRHRRYIQEVLQMYDGNDTTDEDYSDSSMEDNPERNNLFDRLSSRPV